MGSFVEAACVVAGLGGMGGGCKDAGKRSLMGLWEEGGDRWNCKKTVVEVGHLWDNHCWDCHETLGVEGVAALQGNDGGLNYHHSSHGMYQDPLYDDLLYWDHFHQDPVDKINTRK